MAIPPIGSLLLGSSDAERAKQWYRDAFGVTENENGAFEFGSVGLFVEPHSQISGPTKEPARVVINLDVDDARAHEARLKEMNADWERPVEQEDFGLIGTVKDPDGNFIQIIQWGAEPGTH